jgi:hypothetical protein
LYSSWKKQSSSITAIPSQLLFVFAQCTSDEYWSPKYAIFGFYLLYLFFK